QLCVQRPFLVPSAFGSMDQQLCEPAGPQSLADTTGSMVDECQLAYLSLHRFDWCIHRHGSSVLQITKIIIRHEPVLPSAARGDGSYIRRDGMVGAHLLAAIPILCKSAYASGVPGSRRSIKNNVRAPGTKTLLLNKHCFGAGTGVYLA